MLFCLWRKISILHMDLPIEIEILLSMERATYLIACRTEILRKTDILHVEKAILLPVEIKDVLLPVERSAYTNCLWKERCIYSCLWREVY